MRGRLALAFLALSATSCIRPPPPPALLQLDVLRGFASAPAPAATPDRIELLLDLTTSMQEATVAGPLREAAARRAAGRFVAALADDASLGLHALGTGPEEGCGDAVAVLPSPAAHADALELIRGLGTRGESSLAGALEGLGERLAQGSASTQSRIVAFTDLGGQCGGNLCAAVDRLATEGVRLDLVVIGDALVPECVSEYREVRTDGPPAGAPLAPLPRFHVEKTTMGVPAAVAWGEAGGVPVRIEPGLLTVVVEFDPPLRLERTIAPGERWLLQVLEFPAIDPWARRWRWSRLPDSPAQPGGAEVAP